MSESSASLQRRWRYGMHPRAAGLQVRSLGRVDLPLGEALRLEMVDADAGEPEMGQRLATQGADEVAQVQYYISTDLGPWALWCSCAREDIADNEAALREIVPPLAGDAAG